MPIKIFKRGKTYYARGTVAGQSIYESTGCSKRTDANAWAQRREAQVIERHAHGIQATLTFAEAALDYMNAGGERRFLGKILEFFGPDFKLNDLNNSEINRAADALFPTAAPATVNRCLITPCRAVLNLAAEDDKAQVRKLRNRKVTSRRTRWLTPAEADALLFAANGSLRQVLFMLLGSGMRPSEALRVDVSSFHPDTGEIWLDETKTDFPRMTKLPGRARDGILDYGVPESGALIRNPKGKPYVIIPRQIPFKTAFNNARNRAGLGPEVTPYILRHTWATWYHAAERDFGRLMDLGGWRTADVVQRYRKIAPDDLNEQLKSHGWDFSKLGRKIPRFGETRPVIQRGNDGYLCQLPIQGADIIELRA